MLFFQKSTSKVVYKETLLAQTWVNSKICFFIIRNTQILRFVFEDQEFSIEDHHIIKHF